MDLILTILKLAHSSNTTHLTFTAEEIIHLHTLGVVTVSRSALLGDFHSTFRNKFFCFFFFFIFFFMSFFSTHKGDEEETEPLHAETIEMSEPGQNAPPLYRQLGRMAEEGWTSVANLVNNHPIDAEPSVPEIKNDLKKRLYLLLEEPSSSHSAFWTNVFVSLLIVFSAVTTTIETIPAFRSAKSNRVW